MSRARSPRSAKRALGFDEKKIRRFGRACRLARQYFRGGRPGDTIDRWEDDPNYQAGWNLILTELGYETGMPISSISEIENHASYTVGYDSAATIIAFLYLNSKNGWLLEPFLDVATGSGAFLTEHAEIRDRNKLSGYIPACEILNHKPLITLPGNDSVSKTPPVSGAFLDAMEFLIKDWARLTDSSEASAIKAAKVPLEELSRLRELVRAEVPAGEEDEEMRHPDYDRFWLIFDHWMDSFSRRLSAEKLIKKMAEQSGVDETLISVLVYEPGEGVDPIDLMKDRWTVEDYYKLLSVLKDPETGQAVTVGELSTTLGIDLARKKGAVGEP